MQLMLPVVDMFLPCSMHYNVHRFLCIVISPEYFRMCPNRLSDNLGELMTAVKNTQADLGIAVDPDADRLVLIDELGEPIGEEKTIALCVKALLECSDPPFQYTSIALNLSTSIMSEKLAVQAGWDIHRTPVGRDQCC